MEVAVTGIDWVFSPVAAVVRNDRWGRAYEGFSEDPQIVRSYMASMVRGLQGDKATDSLFSPSKVVATAKHFIGDGGTTDGIDQGNTEVSEQELEIFMVKVICQPLNQAFRLSWQHLIAGMAVKFMVTITY